MAAGVQPRTRGISSRALGGVGDSVRKSLVTVGDLATFSGRALALVPSTIVMYPKEVLRQLKDIAWGSGALLVGGGTIGVMILLSIAAGTSIGIEGFNGLEMVGLAPLSGFISAAANTRELAPLVAALALGAQVGCRFTAQVGSMKIHEEIDAMEVMAINPMRYVVTTRIVACMVAIMPLYLVGLLGSYVASQWSVVLLFGQSAGQYDHYFSSFIQGQDIFFSVIKILVFALTIGLLHTWYGMKVGGGPQAVGEATGAAIRASIVTVVVLNMSMTLIFWGNDPGFRMSG
jgi:phospholipid/cholesterol/gamma-HCH transport system permease protein